MRPLTPKKHTHNSIVLIWNIQELCFFPTIRITIMIRFVLGLQSLWVWVCFVLWVHWVNHAVLDIEQQSLSVQTAARFFLESHTYTHRSTAGIFQEKYRKKKEIASDKGYDSVSKWLDLFSEVSFSITHAQYIGLMYVHTMYICVAFVLCVHCCCCYSHTCWYLHIITQQFSNAKRISFYAKRQEWNHRKIVIWILVDAFEMGSFSIFLFAFFLYIGVRWITADMMSLIKRELCFRWWNKPFFSTSTLTKKKHACNLEKCHPMALKFINYSATWNFHFLTDMKRYSLFVEFIHAYGHIKC